jgi:hypothetical protein
MPRDTALRNAERLSNQLELFNQPAIVTDLSVIKRWYAWLTFNGDDYGNLTHLAIGLPAHILPEWLDLLPLGLDADDEFPQPDDEPPPPGPDQLIRFRDDYEKLRDLSKLREDESKDREDA